MSSISVKVDQVAFLRNIRKLKEPDPSHVAVLAEMAGADGISCHLREDRLHIRDRDVYILKEIVKTRLTLQVAPVEDLLERVLEVKPWMVTLMPTGVEESSVNCGIDLENNKEQYVRAAEQIQETGLNVCYFINPDDAAVKEAARAKAYAVEFSTADYLKAGSLEEAENELERLEQMAQLAVKLGMSPHCGGGLNYKNIKPLIDLVVFSDFTVGNAITNRALMVGYEQAVEEMVDLVHLQDE